MKSLSAALLLIALLSAPVAHAQTYECTQVVLQPGLATAYWSAQCQTTDICHPGSGCTVTLDMQEASIVGSEQSTAYQVPFPAPWCPAGLPACVQGQWAYVNISMANNTYLSFVGLFDGPVAGVGGHFEATGDFDLRDELFADSFDTGAY